MEQTRSKYLPCTKCKKYSFPLRRCTNGKINPKVKKNAESSARLMGWDYICNLNPWKQRALVEFADKLGVADEVSQMLEEDAKGGE